jgi:hypothetical protein
MVRETGPSGGRGRAAQSSGRRVTGGHRWMIVAVTQVAAQNSAYRPARRNFGLDLPVAGDAAAFPRRSARRRLSVSLRQA